MAAFHGTPMMWEATDFIISRFREELGLWFEFNDAKRTRGRYVDAADLTDGESTLFLWFTGDAVAFDNCLLLPQLGNLFMAWKEFDDSRREFRQDLMASIAMNALSQFCPAGTRRIARMSFEFRLSSPSGKLGIATWFETTLSQLDFRPMPQWRGKSAELPGFKIVDDVEACWAQLLFPRPTTHSEVVSVLSPGLAGLDDFQVGTSTCHDATTEWQLQGVERAHVLARRY